MALQRKHYLWIPLAVAVVGALGYYLFRTKEGPRVDAVHPVSVGEVRLFDGDPWLGWGGTVDREEGLEKANIAQQRDGAAHRKRECKKFRVLGSAVYLREGD